MTLAFAPPSKSDKAEPSGKSSGSAGQFQETASLPAVRHNFKRIPIHPSPIVIQTKLTVNTPGDQYEQEADRVADQVMRMPEPRLQRKCACGGSCEGCGEKKAEQEVPKLQLKRVDDGSTRTTEAPPIVHEVLSSPGQPLDGATRAYMEPRFGRDFSRVRVYAGADAAQSARSVNAHAYTVGHNIVFSASRLAPDTHEGRRLIAHELAHVVQQSQAERSGVGPNGGGPSLPAATSLPAHHIQRNSGYGPDPDERIEAKDFVQQHWRDHEFNGFTDMAKSLFYNFSVHANGPAYVIEVWKNMPDGIEANVARVFTEMLNPMLDAMTRSHDGQVMLDVLYDAMITGSPDSDRAKQAELIRLAKLRQMGPSAFLKATSQDSHGLRTQIFPFGEQRILSLWHEDAPLHAELLSDGQVWVSYPARVKGDFKAEERTLQGDVFSDRGSILPADEIVGIKDIDEPYAPVHYGPAIELIGYSNRAVHSTLGKIVQVSLAALTFGRAPIGAGAGAQQAGKWAARLALANKIATAVQVFSVLVSENRRRILETFPKAGRRLIQITEIADTAVLVFGVLQLGAAGFKLAADLRKAVNALPGDAKSLLQEEDSELLGKITNETEQLANSLDESGVAANAAAKASEAEGDAFVRPRLTSVKQDGTLGAYRDLGHAQSSGIPAGQDLRSGFPARPGVSVGTPLAGEDLEAALAQPSELPEPKPVGPPQLRVLPGGGGTPNPAKPATIGPTPPVKTRPAGTVASQRSTVAGGTVHPISKPPTLRSRQITSTSGSSPSAASGDAGASSLFVGPNGEALQPYVAPDPVPAPAAVPVPTPVPHQRPQQRRFPQTTAAPPHAAAARSAAAGAAHILASVSPSAKRVPVMPQGMSYDERKQWIECNQLHDSYHAFDHPDAAIDQAAAGIDASIEELKFRINQNTATDQDRVNLCVLLADQIKINEMIYRYRRLYLEGKCDRWDWFDNPDKTEAQRRKSHEDHLPKAKKALKNSRDEIKKYCPPQLSKL